MHDITLSASILSADFARLGEHVQAAIDAGIDSIHFDVMDHHYVPNLTFGANVCRALRDAGIDAPIDVHLMVEHPEQYFDAFQAAGASTLIIHPETTSEVTAALNNCHTRGMRTGLAYNPEQAIDATDEQLKLCDMLLLMSVNPGFGGQSFMPDILPKISACRARLDTVHPTCHISVDGGLKEHNIANVANAGADTLVMGSGLFDADDLAERVRTITQKITGTH